MSYTAQEIHEIAITILDELSDDGSVDVNKTKEYANRAPRLLDAWQKEESNLGNITNIEEYVNTDENALYKWTLLAIPADLKFIKDMMFIDSDLQIGTVQYKQFGKGDIYFYFEKLGTARMLYALIPVKITSLTQTLEVDDSTATNGAYYLAEHYALADMNDELAKKCRDKFAELKYESKTKTPISAESIVDVYSLGGV